MTINISDNNPRISYTATSGQTAFTVPFVFFNDADLNVYINDTLKTITTDYTVTGGDGSTGSITLTSGATSGDIVVITRDVALERTTDFPSSGPFQVASLNTELDTIIAMVADMEDLAERGLRLSDSDTSASLVLADKDARKGTVLAFNATTGAVEVGPTIADTETIASIKADIATLADIEDGTDATDAIQTVAGISSNVTTVAGISSDVTTVAGNNANVTTVAGNDANITTVAGISANVTTVAGISSDVTSVAGDATDIGTVASNIADVNTVAANDANITTVAGQTTNMQNITDNLTAVQNAATNATNAATSASNASTSESNAAASAASAAASFDAFDDRYLGAKTDDPSTDNDGDALDAGDQYFNTTDNELKVYNGSAWQSASVVGGTVTSLTTSSLDANGGTIDGTVIGGTTPAAGTFTTGDFNTSLNVDGTITSDGLIVDGTYTDVKFKTNQGRLDLWLTDTDTTDGQVRIRGDANTLSFITNTTVGMTIDSSQNVGIGTTPDSNALLHLKKTSAVDTILRVENTNAGGYGSVLNLKSTGNFSFSQFEGGTKTWLVGQRGLSGGSFSIYDVDNTAHRMVIDSSGNVGIGTSSPTIQLASGNKVLHLDSGGNQGSEIKLEGNSGLLSIGNTSAGAYFYNVSNTPAIFGTNNTERMRISAAGELGLGVTGTTGGAGDINMKGNQAIRWMHATNGTQYGDMYVDTSNNMVFRNTSSSTERMRIRSGGGITFNGDTAAANALDDYEQGTWTVTLARSGVTFSPSNTTGYYTKIGRLVYFTYYSGAITASATSQSGNTTFSGLPFTSANGTQQYHVFSYVHGTLFSNDVTGGYVNQNNTNAFFVIHDSVSTAVNVSIGSGRYLMISGVYEAA